MIPCVVHQPRHMTTESTHEGASWGGTKAASLAPAFDIGWYEGKNYYLLIEFNSCPNVFTILELALKTFYSTRVSVKLGPWKSIRSVSITLFVWNVSTTEKWKITDTDIDTSVCIGSNNPAPRCSKSLEFQGSIWISGSFGDLTSRGPQAPQVVPK